MLDNVLKLRKNNLDFHRKLVLEEDCLIVGSNDLKKMTFQQMSNSYSWNLEEVNPIQSDWMVRLIQRSNLVWITVMF